MATGGPTFTAPAGAATDNAGVFVAGGDLRPGGDDEVVTAAGAAGQPAAVRVLAGANGAVLNQGTLPQPAGTVGVVRWHGQRAVAVAGTGGVTAYRFEAVGSEPSYWGDLEVVGPGTGGLGGGGVHTQSEGSEYIERLDGEVWWAAQDPGAYATVTSVVSEAEVNGKAAFKWWYEVDNTSVDWVSPEYAPNDPPSGLAGVSITGSYPQATPLGTPQNDWGWDNYAGSFSNGGLGDGAHWLEPSLGEYGGFVYVGDVAHFWYFTEPIPIVTGGGEFFSGGVAGGGGGKALVPGPKPTIEMNGSPNIIVNANTDNWNPEGSNPNDANPTNKYGVPKWVSEDQKFIPKTRDFHTANLWQDDPQLVPMTVTVTGGYAGSVILYVDPATRGGRAKLWADKRKMAPYSAKTVPAGVDPFTFTVFIEGTHESEPNIPTGLGDVNIRAKFIPTVAPPASVRAEKLHRIIPILISFDSNTPAGAVRFRNEVDGGAGMIAQKVTRNGEMVFIEPGIAFTTRVGNLSVPIQFMQNVLNVENGTQGSAAGAVGLNAADNKNFLPTVASKQSFPGAVLDTPVGTPEGNPFYTSIPTPNEPAPPAGQVYIYANDNPGIPPAPVGGAPYNTYDVKYTLQMFVVAAFLDGSIYPLASITWSVVFHATQANAMGLWPDVVTPNSKVVAQPYVRSNASPGKTVGPVANGNSEWR